MTKYIIMVFAGACSYGILSTFVKLAYIDGYSIEEIAVLQAFIGMLVLWLLALLEGKREPGTKLLELPKSDLIFILLAGACIGLASYTYYLSVKYIQASIAVVLLMQFTWLAVFLEWLIFKTRPSLQQLVIIGVILISSAMASGFFSLTINHMPLPGILFALSSALLYAGYILANDRMNTSVKPLAKSAMIMMGSTIGLVVLTASSLIAHHHFDLQLLKWGVFLALFGTIIPPVLFAIGIPKVGATNSSIIMSAEFPVAVLCSYFVLDEKKDMIQWIGVIMMLLAIIGMKLKKAHKIIAV